MEPLKPPSGGDVSHGYIISAPLISTTIVALIMTILRVYTRVWVVKKPDWDDLFNVLATIFMVTAAGLIIPGATDDIGRHMFYLQDELDQVSYELMLFRIAEFSLIISTLWIKISIAFFLIRLFNAQQRTRLFLWTTIVFNTLAGLINAIVIFPACTPVQKNWDPTIPGSCWSHSTINALGYFQGVSSILTDVILSTLPILFLWNVKIKTKTKLGIIALMSMGYASAGFTIVRTINVPALWSADITWVIWKLFLFGILETTVGIIAAALPTLRPLVRSIRGNFTSSSKEYSRKYQSPDRSSSSRYLEQLPLDDYPGFTKSSDDLQQGMYDCDEHSVGSVPISSKQQIPSESAIMMTTDITVQDGLVEIPAAVAKPAISRASEFQTDLSHCK